MFFKDFCLSTKVSATAIEGRNTQNFIQLHFHVVDLKSAYILKIYMIVGICVEAHYKELLEMDPV